MGEKTQFQEEMKTLRRKVQEGKIMVGREKVFKALKAGQLSRVLVARNCPPETKEALLYYAKLAKVSVGEVEQSNEELGIFCKKNYFVSVVGMVGD